MSCCVTMLLSIVRGTFSVNKILHRGIAVISNPTMFGETNLPSSNFLEVIRIFFLLTASHNSES